MRIRSLKPEFFTDRVTGRWPLDLQMFYAALWVFADDEGRFEWEPTLIRAQLFPFHPDLDASGMLERVREAGRVVKYEAGGVAYGYIPAFKEHQHPERPKKSRLPEPSVTHHRNVGDASVIDHRNDSAGRERRGEEGRVVERRGDDSPTTNRPLPVWEQLSHAVMRRVGSTVPMALAEHDPSRPEWVKQVREKVESATNTAGLEQAADFVAERVEQYRQRKGKHPTVLAYFADALEEFAATAVPASKLPPITADFDPEAYFGPA